MAVACNVLENNQTMSSGLHGKLRAISQPILHPPPLFPLKKVIFKVAH